MNSHYASLSRLVQLEIDRFMVPTILLGKSELLLAVCPPVVGVCAARVGVRLAFPYIFTVTQSGPRL